ncbi:MAG: hypothetical protein GY711_13895 [bacterium]|nr:hypothetical protein [bacterium]
MPIPDFVEARIQPLDGTRQKSLLQNWLGAGWDDAWRALEDRPSLVSLCTNPMLLSLVAYSHRMGDGDTTLPRTRCGG